MATLGATPAPRCQIWSLGAPEIRLLRQWVGAQFPWVSSYLWPETQGNCVLYAGHYIWKIIYRNNLRARMKVISSTENLCLRLSGAGNIVHAELPRSRPGNPWVTLVYPHPGLLGGMGLLVDFPSPLGQALGCDGELVIWGDHEKVSSLFPAGQKMWGRGPICPLLGSCDLQSDAVPSCQFYTEDIVNIFPSLFLVFSKMVAGEYSCYYQEETSYCFNLHFFD